MSANQPPSPPPSSPPPPSGGGKGPLIAVIGVLAIVAIGVGVMQARKKPTTGTPTTTPDGPISSQPIKTGAFDTATRPQVGFGELEGAPAQETPELFWIDVADPKAVHDTLRKNAWLGKAIKDPVGQGFIAAWGGFFGTRGEDIGDVFKGAVTDLVLDQVLAEHHRLADHIVERQRLDALGLD